MPSIWRSFVNWARSRPLRVLIIFVAVESFIMLVLFIVFLWLMIRG